MKYQNTLLIALVCLTLSISCKTPRPSSKIPKKDRIELAWQHEFDMTHDPATMTVPRERLFQAEQLLRTQRSTVLDIGWQSRGADNCGGRTISILPLENDSVLAGSASGGLWLFINGVPQRLEGFSENLAVSAIAKHNDTIWIGTGEGTYNADAVRGNGLYFTTDLLSFHKDIAHPNVHYINDIVFYEGNKYVATNTGLYKNNTMVLSGGIADLEIFKDSLIVSQTAIFGSGTLYKTKGVTFEVLHPTDATMKRCIMSAINNTLWIIYSDNGYQGRIKKYQNGTWTTITAPSAYGMSNFARGQAWYNLALYAPHEDTVYIGGIDILRTTNGGSTWTQISQWYGASGFPNIHADQHEFVPAGDSILIGNDGGFYTLSVTQNASLQFANHESGYITSQFYSVAEHPTDNDYFLGGTQDNGSHRFNQPGMNSTVEVTGGDGAFCHISQVNPNIQFTSYVYNNYFKSTNGGNSFTTGAQQNSGRFINPSDYDDENDIMYAASSSGQYFFWANASTTNSFTNKQVTGIGVISAIKYAGNNTLYVGNNIGAIYKIENANTTPIATQIRISGGYISCIEVVDSAIYATISTYGNPSSVIRSTGSGWDNLEYNLPDIPIRWIAGFNGNIVIATELGVWYLDNGIWIQTDLPNVRTDMVKFNPNGMLYAATHGLGIWTSNYFQQAQVTFNVDKSITYTGVPIQFTETASQDTSWLWDFGDGNTSTEQNPVHTYSTLGIYNVTLTTNAGSATIDSIVHILPIRQVHYIAQFEGNFPLDFAGTGKWERGVPSNFLTTVQSGFNVWKTGLDADLTVGDYEDYLYSPLFDLTTPGTYSLKFNRSMEVQYCNAPVAVQVQYTLDSGATWQALDGTGLGYNPVGGCQSAIISPSYAGNFNNVPTEQFINNFSGKIVGFRFVLKVQSGWTGGYGVDGFMIDDFMVIRHEYILPVTLLSFNGKYSDLVVLNWQVEHESVDFYLINNKRTEGRYYDHPDYREGWNYYTLSESYNGVVRDIATTSVYVPRTDEVFTYVDMAGRKVEPTVSGMYLKMNEKNEVVDKIFLHIR